MAHIAIIEAENELSCIEKGTMGLLSTNIITRAKPSKTDSN